MKKFLKADFNPMVFNTKLFFTFPNYFSTKKSKKKFKKK